MSVTESAFSFSASVSEYRILCNYQPRVLEVMRLLRVPLYQTTTHYAAYSRYDLCCVTYAVQIRESLVLTGFFEAIKRFWWYCARNNVYILDDYRTEWKSLIHQKVKICHTGLRHYSVTGYLSQETA